jgi:DEAD/DEAH box helicase domain-containing protein
LGPDNVIDVLQLGAGRAALRSFAECFKIAAAAELDIVPSEFQVGYQPARIGQSRTEKLFIADSLENGAGYAAHLGDAKVLRSVLNRIINSLRPKWEAQRHRSQCDASCPDCLRNYDNRHLHPYLDWRLALDVAESALGLQPDEARWFLGGAHLANSFVQAYERTGIKLTAGTYNDVPFILREDLHRAVILSAPLWRSENSWWQPTQRAAVEEVKQIMGPSVDVRFVDLFTHIRQPHKTFLRLI